jgi:hypothetical protein
VAADRLNRSERFSWWEQLAGDSRGQVEPELVGQMELELELAEEQVEEAPPIEQV